MFICPLMLNQELPSEFVDQYLVSSTRLLNVHTVHRVTLRQRISGNWRGHRAQPNDLILKKKKKRLKFFIITYAAWDSLGRTWALLQKHTATPLSHQPTALWHMISGMSRLIPRLSGDTAPIKSQKTVSELIWLKTFTNLYLFQCEGYSLKKKIN